MSEGTPVPRHLRNPRRAYDANGQPIVPMDIRNARENRVTGIEASCRCGHQAIVPLDRFGDRELVPDVGLRLVCSGCGRKGVDTRPSWGDVSVLGHPGGPPQTKTPAAG